MVRQLVTLLPRGAQAAVDSAIPIACLPSNKQVRGSTYALRASSR